jgi:hypothetical protein
MLAMEQALGHTREDMGLGASFAEEAPKFVKAVPRFLPDLMALRALMSSEKPPLKRARCSKVAMATCSFVDASGRGFGSTFQVGSRVFFQCGQWPERISETVSSNWRELANLVESLEAEVRERGLSDCEIFLFADNTAAEAAHWKGASKSEWLFDLVLRLRLMEMRNDLIIHVIHVAGTRMKVFFLHGQWPERISETVSSNWRELANLVESLEAEVRERGLSDCEIFLFADNTAAEAAHWKGTSKSEWLFDLVLRLHLMEMRNDLIIQVIRVAGTRMKAQGTDGISRGDKSMGVMRGIPMEEFCPLHQTAFERSPELKSWLTAAAEWLEPTFLDSEGWFLQGQGAGNFVWSPAPAAADAAVEQLGKARHKRSASLHLIVAPRLFTGKWRRHMTQESDLYFKITAGDCSLWGANQCKPVLIFLCLPFTIARPNFEVRQRLLEDCHRSMLKEGLWKGSGKRGGVF